MKPLLAALMLMSSITASAQVPMANTSAEAALFEPIASVLTHPRCLNCHQAEAPRQTDKGIRHAQGVVRGKDGHGAPGQMCMACHQASNTANDQVPGAPHWHLAPTSMSWQGLKAGDICRQIKDPARNGNRHSAAQVIDHMASDPLVLWAWKPGASRSTPPLSHPEFLAALRTWADRGLPCPN